MSIAVCGGLYGLYADMKRNYFRASALQEKKQVRRDDLYKRRDKWLARQRLSIATLNLFFVIGVASSVLYLVTRILYW